MHALWRWGGVDLHERGPPPFEQDLPLSQVRHTNQLISYRVFSRQVLGRRGCGVAEHYSWKLVLFIQDCDISQAEGNCLVMGVEAEKATKVDHVSLIGS